MGGEEHSWPNRRDYYKKFRREGFNPFTAAATAIAVNMFESFIPDDAEFETVPPEERWWEDH